jgi:amicyanin
MSRLAFVMLVLVAGVAGVAFGAEEKKRRGGAEVEIKGMKFEPAEVRVKVGETVTWVNKDDRDHTAVADDRKGFKSGNIKRGGTFEQKFTKAGKYPYACTYHPRMKGVVVVE